MNEPMLVLADEPTGNFDPDLALEIMNLFREINARGTTVVVATHDRELIRLVGRRAIMLEHGVITEESSAVGDGSSFGVKNRYQAELAVEDAEILALYPDGGQSVAAPEWEPGRTTPDEVEPYDASGPPDSQVTSIDKVTRTDDEADEAPVQLAVGGDDRRGARRPRSVVAGELERRAVAGPVGRLGRDVGLRARRCHTGGTRGR